MPVSVSTTDGTQVSVTIDGSTLLSFTTEESSVNVVNGGSTSVSVTNQGPKGDKGETGPQGPVGPQGPAGEDGAGGLVDVVDDTTPQLGGNLDVQAFNLFTSATDQDIMFTPSGTGSINLDGTVKFKRFTSAPTAFEGGMYADNNDNLYFGVS